MKSFEAGDNRSWSHLALFASLATSADVAAAIRDRRAGRDASEQESEKRARTALAVHARDLGELLVRLEIHLLGSALPGSAESPSAGMLRRFPMLLLLIRLAGLLHRIHQRLLSLYPLVDAELVEDVRTLESNARALTFHTTESFQDDVASLCENSRHLLTILGPWSDA